VSAAGDTVTAPYTVGDHLADRLAELGVDRVFGVCPATTASGCPTTSSSIRRCAGPGAPPSWAPTDPGDRYGLLDGWFEVGGDNAEPLVAARVLAPLAAHAGIGTCLVVVPGGEHTFAVSRAAFRDALPFLTARLGMIPQTETMNSGCADLS
jgi:hypothetical protein